jgi:hypothetical protein
MKGVVVHSSLALPWLRSTFNYYLICQVAKAGKLMVKVKPYQPIQQWGWASPHYKTPTA